MSWSRKSSEPTNTRNATTTARLKVQLANRQRRDAVPSAWLNRLAICAVRRLRIRQDGRLIITFIDRATMRTLNRRFTRRNRLTDVLSFRYPDEPARKIPPPAGSRVRHVASRSELYVPVVGEILIAPACARQYARGHKLPYRQELARYVIHGLLHWLGHDDKTPTQQRKMRRMEDQLLAQCAQ